jgi:hypothetical protein
VLLRARNSFPSTCRSSPFPYPLALIEGAAEGVEGPAKHVGPQVEFGLHSTDLLDYRLAA